MREAGSGKREAGNVKVVVVFGGGGAKALAHAGAWQALQEHGATVTHIVGTSMGAVIGAALAAGATPAQVVSAAASLTPRDVASLDLLALVKGVFASSGARGSQAPLPPPPAAARLFPPPLIRAHGEAIRVMMAAQSEAAIARWPASAPRLVVVRAVAEREATFAVGQTERYFSAGYEKTKRAMQGLDG